MDAVVSVGKSVLNGLLSGAKSAIAEEAALTQSVQRDAVFLADELAAMQSYLRDADEERNRHKVPRSRVKQVRHLAYDVEDCLQEYSVRLEKHSGWRLARTVLDRHRIAEQMKGLRSRVEDMSHRNLRYRLFEDTNPNAEITSARRFGEKRQVDLFLESEQVDLLPLIREKDQELRVIAVWGACGDPRKMSIVRRAYDDLKRNNKFGCYAWIKVTHPISPSEFLHRVMRQFYVNYLLEEAGRMTTQGEETSAVQGEGWGFRSRKKAQGDATVVGAQVLKKMVSMKHDALADEFNKHVSQKSYLIVLNDLSTIEDWDWIKTYFPNNKNGSRIIVSTEQAEVASLFAGPDKLVVELKQSSASQTIYAFCEKGTMKPGASSKTVATSDETETMDVDALKESHLVGRQKQIADIIKLICHEQSQDQLDVNSENKESQDQLEVISLCGKGGLGKTTLVKYIYQHQELDGVFEKRACVTIKHPFNYRELIRSLATQLFDDIKEDQVKGEKTNQEEDPQWWASQLKNKKYLIVLDDLSSTREWDDIKKYFPETEKPSRIIVTTGGEEIAKHCSKDKNIFRLRSLENDDAHNLFIKKVFGSIIKLDEEYPELVEEAKSILKKCNGSPLAIISIGGHLAKRSRTIVEWRKLNEYIGAEVEMNQGSMTTRTILTKCFEILPYDLKSCFLYLSIFPQEQNISRRRLVHRWAAEGYSGEVHGKYAKDTADSYFMELMERSMIEPSDEAVGSTKAINSCQVNDLIHEISTSKSMEEDLVFRLEEGCSLHTHGNRIRHLAIVSDKWKGGRNEFENTVNPRTIRSLTVFGKWRPFFISEKMRMLRVLDLEGTSGLNDHHLEHIGKLLQLKYLSLRGCRDICHLPHSLGNLRQLETLDIKHTAVIRLPKAIIRLSKLQYLRVGGHGAFGGTPYEELVAGLPRLLGSKLCLLPLCSVACCCVACCAPQAVRSSVWETGGDPNMRDVCTAWCCTVFPFVARRLDPRGVLVPGGVNMLTVLHTLGTVNISRRHRGKAVLRDIARLTRLRKLGVAGVSAERNSRELCWAIAALGGSLESLSVLSAGEPGLEGCLESDAALQYSPPVNLKSLKLDGNLLRLPGWIRELRNLVKLSLRRSRLLLEDKREDEDKTAMEMLAQLPNLTILRLQQESFQGEELGLTFHGHGGAFPSLRVLQLILVARGLKSVKFEQGAMPKLELLQFCGQPSRTGADFFSGLGSLPSLKRFRLDDDARYSKEFVENLRRQLSDNPKKPTLKRYVQMSRR